MPAIPQLLPQLINLLQKAPLKMCGAFTIAA
jgi:hypothetical protein